MFSYINFGVYKQKTGKKTGNYIKKNVTRNSSILCCLQNIYLDTS